MSSVIWVKPPFASGRTDHGLRAQRSQAGAWSICRARKNASARCGDLERPEKVVRPLIHALAAGEQVELALPVDNDDAAGRLRALLEHYLTRVAAREVDCLRR